MNIYVFYQSSIYKKQLALWYLHAYQPFLILKGEFHDLKVGDWGLKGEIFSAINLTVEIFTIERNLDNYAGQGGKVKNVGTDRKVMSQGIHMWNMVAVPIMVQK